jgi:hypothetical protein
VLITVIGSLPVEVQACRWRHHLTGSN